MGNGRVTCLRVRTLSKPLDTTDYLWVLSRQLDRVAELATNYFNDASRKPAIFRAKAFIGAVIVVYALALPVLEEEGKVSVSELKENYKELMQALENPAGNVKRALEAWSELIRALQLSGLLYRTGASPMMV